ncbi:L-xylulose 5-phosphate 3-epimerase [Escherichia coli]|nr:L-xylulose 5-phosphate 3-epimerase [Escherichia coli]
MRNHPLGIYEKALAKDLSWPERLVLAKSCGFDFVEMSVDETDERLSRLDWSTAQRTSLVAAMIETGVGIPSMCLSAHRRFPFGSRDDAVRQRAREIMSKAIRLARDLGIRTIQLAGYDVYYEDHDEGTRQRFAEGLAWAVEQAAASQVMLAVEIMDTAFMNSISKWKKWDEMLASPWFTVYPDVGNLSAWGNDVPAELKLGIDRIAAIHLKDTQPVTEQSPGQFRDVPFGEGCVDFVGIFKTLHKLNYRGSFLIEMWTEKPKSRCWRLFRRGVGLKRVCRRLDLYVRATESRRAGGESGASRSPSGDVHLGQCQRGRRNAAMDGNQTFRRRVRRDDRRRYGGG